MPAFCSVLGCSNRGERDEVRFYRMPASFKDRGIKLDALSRERRDEWIKSLKRGSLSDTFLQNARICSNHFVSGAPADIEDKENPDWIPTLNMGYTTIKEQSQQSVQRHKRSVKRVKRMEEIQGENSSIDAEVEAAAGQSIAPDVETIEVPFI